MSYTGLLNDTNALPLLDGVRVCCRDLFTERKHIAAPSKDGAVIYPVKLDLWKQDARKLLRDAEQAAGMKLEDFTSPGK